MDSNSILDCYLYYMWNVFNEDRCMDMFGQALGEHIWTIWISSCRHWGRTGAAATFYAELDSDKRRTLADHAYRYYNCNGRMTE